MTNNGHGNKWMQRHETFCLRYHETGNGTQSAIDAHYSPRTARFCASRLLTYGNIKARLTELRQQALDASIGTVQERDQRLTEIYRARITDFMTAGADGSWIDIGPENPHAGAIQEITSKTEYDKDGNNPAVITKVKLHDPVRAIAEQNKRDKIYTEGTTVNVDNRKVEITVVSDKAKNLLDEVIEGSGTEKEKE